MPDIRFFYGNDEYAIARKVREAGQLFKDSTEAEMNTARLDARTMTDEQWANAINALPFLASQRLVLLTSPSARFALRRRSKGEQAGEAGGEEAQARADKSQAETSAEARKKFLQSIEAMPDSTRLVISEVVELRTKQDRMAAEKHWLATWMTKNHHPVQFLSLPGGDAMSGWIAREARDQGGSFAGEATVRLAAMVGSDTRQAAQEVTKLLTYVNRQRPVTAADVDALSPLTAVPDVFKMVEALGSGKSGEAQALLHRLMEFQDAFSTWGMIIRQFRHLLVAREVLDAKGSQKAVEDALSEVEGRPIHSYVAEQAMKQARGFSMAKLESIYRRLLQIDQDAKTGRMPLDMALDLLVVELGK